MTTKYFNVKNGMTTGNVLVSEANVTLGNVSNLHISGGNSGYILKTDGNSILSWVDPAATQSAAPMPIVIDTGRRIVMRIPVCIHRLVIVDGCHCANGIPCAVVADVLN